MPLGAQAVAEFAAGAVAVDGLLADAGPQVLAGLGAVCGPAEESTFRRAFALVSLDVLDRVLCAWLWTRAVRPTAGW